MMGSMFGAYAPPQGGGMFGSQQQQSPLLQMLGGGGGNNPQLMQIMQMLLAGGNQAQGQRGMTFPEQYNATAGSVPGTVDQNILRGVPPQGQQPNSMFGVPPDVLRMLLAPRGA